MKTIACFTDRVLQGVINGQIVCVCILHSEKKNTRCEPWLDNNWRSQMRFVKKVKFQKSLNFEFCHPKTDGATDHNWKKKLDKRTFFLDLVFGRLFVGQLFLPSFELIGWNWLSVFLLFLKTSCHIPLGFCALTSIIRYHSSLLLLQCRNCNLFPSALATALISLQSFLHVKAQG